MQLNKKEQRRKRHLAARRVTFQKHAYVLFDGKDNLTNIPRHGNVIIAGLPNTGQTTALMEIAMSLPRSTPKPIAGMRHLLLIRACEMFAPDVWSWLYTQLVTGNPFMGRLEPNQSEKNLRAWLKGYGFDIVIMNKHARDIDTSQYEVIHEFDDEPLHWTHGVTKNPGVKVSMRQLYKPALGGHHTVTSTGIPSKVLFGADVVLKTLGIETSDEKLELKVELLRYKRGAAGTVFPITSVKREI